MRLMLHGLQSAINIGSILRVAETFGVPVDIWDAHGLFAGDETLRWISDFSCGAYQRGAFTLLDAPPGEGPGGRVIATCVTGAGAMLDDFVFEPDDRVAIGNEYDGLPAGFIEKADVRLCIPMPKSFTPKPPSSAPADPARAGFSTESGDPVLSAAMSAGIICYAAHAQRLSRTGR